MKPRIARAVTYGIVAVLGAVALRFTPQFPERKAAEVLASQQGEARPVMPWSQRFDTLGRGETLTKLFRRGGISDTDATHALQAASVLDARHVRAGMSVEFRQQHTESTPSEIILQLALDRFLHLKRTAEGWVSNEEHLAWKTDTVVVAGTIHSNLYAAVDASAGALLNKDARQTLTWNLADVYDYKIDMSRDLQDGDSFRVMAERQVAPTGAQKVGKIIAAAFTLSGNTLQAIHFASQSVGGEYFDQNGKSLRAQFLRAPLEFRRISSVFGGREHPILGGWRMHKGIDYAAAMGTQVRAIGDGIVVRKGWGNGYGNVLEIRHRNGFVTRYGHLRGYAAGIHVGSRVSISQTVAYVGSTGLSTGPHLHFEVLVGGVQRDPRSALKTSGGEPIPSGERGAFMSRKDVVLAALDRAPANAPLALAAR